MHVCELDHQIPVGHWIANWNPECPDYSDAGAILRAHRPVIEVCLRDVFGRERLDEMTYKELIAAIDPVFLNQERPRPGRPNDLPDPGRAGALRGVYYKRFDHNTMVFDVTSSEIDLNGVMYMNLVRFMDWDEIGADPDMTPREKALMLLWTSDIQVHCDDPSFLYWGYQYILTQLNASIYQEPRFPSVNNPGLRGIVCKHLNRVLRALPFYSGDLAKEITRQFGGKVDKTDQRDIQRRETLSQQQNALPPDQVQPEPEPQTNPFPDLMQRPTTPDLNNQEDDEDTPNETL